MSEPSEGARLAAKGQPVQVGGREMTVRYSNASLLWIEETWGSISALAVGDEEDRPYTKYLNFVYAGLLHERGFTEPPAGLTLEEFADATTPPDLMTGGLLAAANAAWAEAFPTVAAKAAPRKPKGSPGSSGTTTPPLSSVEPIASSG